MWAASCLASCCAACACEACRSVAGSISRRSARIAYCGLFALSLVVSWILRKVAAPLMESLLWINHFHKTPDREWFETDAMLRVSLGNFLFFTILAVLMIGIKNQKDPRDQLHHGGWMAKIVCWCIMVFLMFFVPNSIVSFYESISKFGSGLFLLVQETLRVKDEELFQLAKDIRARDSTIKEIADKLTETAEAAAFAAHAMDEERRIACEKIERLTKDSEKELEISHLKLSESEEKVMVLSKEKELLIKQRDSALQEARLWRSELAKAREQAVVLEAAVVRAEERARAVEGNAEARIKDASEKAAAAAKEKEDLLALVNLLNSQVERLQSNTKQICEERSESCSGADNTPLTKRVNSSEDDVDKACLSDSRLVPVSSGTVVQLAEDGVEIHSIGDAGWGGFRSADERIADVREIVPEAEGSSLDISVVSPTTDDN